MLFYRGEKGCYLIIGVSWKKHLIGDALEPITTGHYRALNAPKFYIVNQCSCAIARPCGLSQQVLPSLSHIHYYVLSLKSHELIVTKLYEIYVPASCKDQN